MTSASVHCTDEQISVWLRGLLTLAWADDDFSEAEQSLITSLTNYQVTQEGSADGFEPVQMAELVATFGQDAKLKENFLRTAVMVSLADGVYTSSEDEILAQFCEALGSGKKILAALRLTMYTLTEDATAENIAPPLRLEEHPDVLRPVRAWLDHLEIQDPKIAHFLCKLIPAQCPFERDVVLFGRKLVHIPAMCKLNPLYEQLVGLRFRALSYLADERGEDVSGYC